MIGYILQVVLFQLLFLGVYELLLKKETFFTWNRWYLLSTAVVSLLLPFIEIGVLSAWFAEENVTAINVNWFTDELTEAATGTAGATATTATAPGFSINWWLIIYAAGAGVNLYLLHRKWQELSRLFRFRAISSEKDFRIIEVPNSTIACTFNKTIFLGDQISEAEKHQVLTHELVHVKQKHSLDLMFFEICKVILWFNPLIYIYQKRIAALHEYLADAGVVVQGEKRSYYEQLLNSAFSTKDISFINQFFNHSLIKKRIIMIQRSRSKSTAKIKYLALLPLVLLMLSFVAYSGTGITNGEIEFNPGEELPVQQLEIPFAVVDQIPGYPGCEAGTGDAARECFSKNLKNYVMSNFNTMTVKPYLKEGSNRIILVFTIGSNGEVTGIKSRMVTPGIPVEDKAVIEKEANRVAQTIPKMKPGIHDGKEVGVSYSIPIEVFNTGLVD